MDIIIELHLPVLEVDVLHKWLQHMTFLIYIYVQLTQKQLEMLATHDPYC